MSNFYCPKCQKEIIDSPKGYITGCVHFPIVKREESDAVKKLKDIFNIK